MTTAYLMPDGTVVDYWESFSFESNAGLAQGSLNSMEYMGLIGLFGPAFRYTSGIPFNPKPDSEGWFYYGDKLPPEGILCQFKQGEDGHPFVCFPDFNEMFNVANLYWRLTGIGKHQLGE